MSALTSRLCTSNYGFKQKTGAKKCAFCSAVSNVSQVSQLILARQNLTSTYQLYLFDIAGCQTLSAQKTQKYMKTFHFISYHFALLLVFNYTFVKIYLNITTAPLCYFAKQPQQQCKIAFIINDQIKTVLLYVTWNVSKLAVIFQQSLALNTDVHSFTNIPIWELPTTITNLPPLAAEQFHWSNLGFRLSSRTTQQQLLREQ